ncbi:MAG TPA: hypothetical protein VGV35_08100 [Bryobacteraceae bacterium]|nr:hypothetical protein [Bryobacteraceae bacterium]
MTKRNRGLSILLPIFFLAACSHPEAYPPPAQVVLPSGPEPAVAPPTGPRQMVAMSDPDADAHILADVFPANDDPEYRFTGLHPRFRLEVRDPSRLVFYLRFFNAGDALLARGPVSFTVKINGKKFRSQNFVYEGGVEYRHLLPDGTVTQPGSVEVSLDISPPWHYPGDGTLGLMLHTIGFEQAPK